jgi:hypothetical protein
MFCFSANDSFAQKNASTKKAITAEFLYAEVEYKEIAVMTNVLKVKNNNGKTYTFNVTVNLPGGWKTLNNGDKEYTLNPNDSVYVPIRVITSDKKAKGGTKYNIAVYINTNEGKQMAYARFLAGRPKVSNWQMQVLPRPRIYMLNGENSADFQINLANEGDEPQDVLVSMKKIGKDFLVKDTTGKLVKKNYFETTLAPYSDTTMSFKVQIQEKVRNQKRIDQWGYNPAALEREKRYGLFLRANEVSLVKSASNQKNKKIDFLKLSNNIDFVKLNNTSNTGAGSNTIPLTVFANINNVLGQQPMMMLSFQGNAQTGKYSSLNYQFQTGFSYFKYSNEFLTDRLVGNATYNFKKGYVGIGSAIGASITRGLSVGGRGLIGGYQLNKNHLVTAVITRQKVIGVSNRNVYGLGYVGNMRFLRIKTNANILTNSSNQLIGYGLFSNLNFRLPKQINFGVFGFYTSVNPNSLLNLNILGSGFNLGKNFKKYSTALNVNYNFNSNTGLSSNLFFQNLSAYLLNQFNFKKGRSISLLNSYMIFARTNSFLADSSGSVIFNNMVTYIPKASSSKINWTPAAFFNYNKYLIDTLVTGGAQFNISKSDFEKNWFAGGNLRLAYNQLLNNKALGTFFTSQVNAFVRYKVWNAMAMYNYGPIAAGGISNTLKNDKIYSQMLRLTLGHQYQFKNNHFVWENNPTYMYMNTIKRHNFSIFSQLFYFTNNGFRFSVNMNLNVFSGLSYKYNYSGTTNNVQIEELDKRTITKSFNLGFTIKKDFSIPIPKRLRKNKFCDAKFVVFLDVNGNNRMDEGEVPVENVVLRMNDFEVITDDKGMASFINMAFAKYRMQVFPLVDMGSWFPNVSDSADVCGPDLMYVPFSKGVQVYGGVELDREAYSGELFDKLDISRFKIYMVDSIGRTFSSITDNKGNYNFYVPYAKYTLKFDDKVLGSSFYLAENDIKLDLTSGIESYYHNFLIIEKKRRVKKKIFNADGSVTIIDEDAGSKKTDTNKNSNDSKSAADKNKLAGGKDGKTKDGTGKGKDGLAQGKDGKDGAQSEVSTQSKEQQLDSLINVLNRLIARAATRIDVRAIVKQEMQKLIDELNASFTINIEELPKGKNPTGMLMQLLRLNKVIETKLPNGSRVYTSGDYKNISDAEKFCRDYQTSGFKKAKVVKKTPQK